MFKKMTTLLLLLGGISAHVSFAEESTHYMVAVTASSQGVVIGEPSLLVKTGVLSSVSVSGESSYDLSVKLTKSDDLTLVNTQFTASEGKISPTLAVELGKTAIVRVDNIELAVLVTHVGS